MLVQQRGRGLGEGYEGVYPVGEAGAQVYVSGEDGVRVRGYGEWAFRELCLVYRQVEVRGSKQKSWIEGKITLANISKSYSMNWYEQSTDLGWFPQGYAKTQWWEPLDVPFL